MNNKNLLTCLLLLLSPLATAYSLNIDKKQIDQDISPQLLTIPYAFYNDTTDVAAAAVVAMPAWVGACMCVCAWARAGGCVLCVLN